MKLFTVETETSIYEVSLSDGKFTATKVAIKEGEESNLAAGRTFTSSTIAISPERMRIGNPEEEGFHTSEIVKIY